jgi:uncharacterized protein YkwD
MKRTPFCVTLSCFAFFISLVSFAPNKNVSLVEDVLSQTNQFRNSKGLPILIIRSDLNDIAQKHSSDMAKGRVGFGHYGFEKRNAQASKKLTPMHSFAENVAFGARTGKEVVYMWKNSPGHRKNMLGRYKYIGIGTAKDRQGRIYYTQVFAG